jgi:hypothetical protein
MPCLATIVRVRDLPTLYKRACTIAVEDGGFPLAWVGLLNRETGRVTPVASAGAAEGYLETLGLSIRDNPDDRSPVIGALLGGALRRVRTEGAAISVGRVLSP